MTYLKAEQNEDAPLYEYTLMPTNIRGYFRKISFAVGSWWKGPGLPMASRASGIRS